MKILNLLLLLIPVTTGLVVRIGGLFDTDNVNTRKIFDYAAVMANSEILKGSGIKFDTRTAEVAYGNEFEASDSVCDLLRSGVSAIFGPSSPSSSSHCMNICDAKEIPYIDVKWDADTKPPVINMHPHPDAMADIFVDLIKASDWKGFTIVYESAPWLKRVAKLLKLYDSEEYTVTVRRIDVGLDRTNYRPVLRRVKLSGDANIVLDCSVDTLPEVLKQAQQVGLMSDDRQILITTLDMHTIDLEPYQYNGANITGIRLFDPENPLAAKITNYLAGENDEENEAKEDEDESKDDSLESVKADENVEIVSTPVAISVQAALIHDGVLLLAEALKQFDVDQLSLRALNCNDDDAWEIGNSITNFMRNTMVQGLTGEIKFDNRGHRTNFAVDVIALTSSGIAKLAGWNATEGLRTTLQSSEEETIYVDDNGDMKNRTFRVITAITPPYGMLRESIETLTGNDRFEGFGIDLIHELSLMLGFKYEFILQKDGVYGNIDNVTQKWNGMIGELIEKRADLAITDLTITAERESGVDFTMPFMNLGISILIKTPTKQPPSTFTFMSPFSMEVWLYLGLAYVGVSLCFFILGRFSPSEWDNPFPCIEEPTQLQNQFSLANSMWFTIGAILQQGSEIAPKAASTRAVASIWWFFTLIMVSSYTANLAAFLTVDTPAFLIQSAEDLKDCANPDFKCPVRFGAKKGGSTINFFKEAEHETYQNMYTYMSNNPDQLTQNNEEGLEKAKTQNYAFLMESASIEYLIERHCEVTQIGKPLDDKGYGIAMRKNSSYRSALSEAVLKLQERGRLTEMKIKWWKEKKGGGSCSKKAGGGEAEELEIQNMFGVFFVLAVGSAFASLYGIFEWIVVVFLRSKRGNVPFKYELKDEIKFVVKCGGSTKPVRHRKSASITNSNRSCISQDKEKS